MVAAYKAFWMAFAGAANPPKPDSPELAKHAVEPELSKDRQAIKGWAADSAALQAKYSHRDPTATVKGASAVVQDCLSLTGAVVDSRTKKVKAKTNPTPVPVSVELKLISGVWKVANVGGGKQACSVAPTPTSSTKVRG